MDNRPVGIFDSGVGGLTIVREVMKALPYEDIIYFGDTARVPYGSKSKETVTKFSRQTVNFLISKNVKAIIIACNTVSSNCCDILEEEFDIPMINVLEPGALSCLEATKKNKVGVIGTERTILSGAYEKKINEINPNVKVYSKACPLFVPLAEEGWTNNTVAHVTAEIYLQELIDKEIDVLLLGCTHYPLLMECIKRTIGNINIVNPAYATVLTMNRYLSNNNMLREVNSEPNYTFYVSDNTSKFDKTCTVVLNRVFHAEIIDVGND